jgi:putative polyhydroxyalkanoate system protein
MADISVSRSHNLDPEELRQRLDKLAEEMTSKYGVQCRWEGDVCHLSGSVLKGGRVTMDPASVQLELTLTALARMMKKRIEQEVAKGLDHLLS